MDPLVDPAWVARQLEQPPTVRTLIILDATLPPVGVTPPVDVRARYLAEHLPGALFFDIDQLSDPAAALPHMLPTADSFARSMSALGVSDASPIVVYEQSGVFSAPRARWMLRVFGAREVYLLHGGLEAWRAAGLPLASGDVPHPPARFHAKLDSSAVETFAGIERAIAARAQILDARSAGRFHGTSPEPRPGLPSGHMPGSINIPFTELVDNLRLKSSADLRRLFAARGVDLNRPITTSCGSGVTAAVLSLGLELAGAQHVRLYDGSWTEYAQQPHAIVATSQN
ncbi:MAG: 3-mercaptopyruvate sulfurtransferase [Nitrososphaerales archaeon]